MFSSDRVIAGPVVDADDVTVRFDQAGKDGLAAEVDRPRRACRHRGGIRADCDEAAIPDRHGVGDGVGAVHGVDAAIDQNEIGNARLRQRAQAPKATVAPAAAVSSISRRRLISFARASRQFSPFELLMGSVLPGKALNDPTLVPPELDVMCHPSVGPPPV